MDRYSPELNRVKQILRQSPRGMTVIELSRAMNINRNSMAKYLDVLVISGEVEFDRIGPAKHFFLSQRMPLYEMLSVTSDCILILDSLRIVTFANSAFLEAEEIDQGEIVGKRIADLNLKMVNAEIAAGLLNAGPGVTLEKELTLETERQIRIFKIKIIGTVLQGGVHGFTVFYEDITKKRLCQERLRSSERLYRAVVEDQTEFIIRYLPDRTVIFANEAYCRAFGIVQEDIIGKVFTPPIPPRDMKRISALLSDISPENQIVSIENPVIMPDMSVAWHQWTNRGIFNDKGILIEYQSVGRDITHLIKGEKAKMGLIFEISLLSDFTTGLLTIDDVDQLYDYLAGYLKKTGPHSLIIILSFSENQGSIRVITQGTHWRNKRWSDFFESLKNRPFPCISGIKAALSPEQLSPLPDYVITYPGMSGTPFSCLGRYLKQYEVQCMGIRSDDSSSGSVLFISRTGNSPGPARLIETLLKQTGACTSRLTCKMTNDVLS